jgi:putative ABC transport system substrate-binding protein
MRRRDFLGFVGGAAASVPIAVRAQQPATPRIGYLWPGPRTTDSNNAGLRQGLTERGYVVGRNIAFEERYADGNAERIPALISELLAHNIDVLVTFGSQTARAAQHATKTVPIVCMSSDPVGAGLVASLSHPGGNITGTSLLAGDYSAKWLPLLKELAPKLQHVAVLWNPDNLVTPVELERMREAARPLGLDLTLLSMRSSEVEASLATITTTAIEGLVITDDPLLDALQPRIIALAAQHQLPAIYPFSNAVQQGGLISYSANFLAMTRIMADYVDRILKGAHPADLPVEQATDVSLKLNLKTAKTLGVSIPPALLATADEVIE